MIYIHKDTCWISIAGHRQKVSELPLELRKKLGIEDLPSKEEKVVIRKKVVEEPEEIKISSVRTSTSRHENVKPRKVYQKSEDSDMDIIAKFIGRVAGRTWVNLTRR